MKLPLRGGMPPARGLGKALSGFGEGMTTAVIFEVGSMKKTLERSQPKLAKTERRLAALLRAGFRRAPACVANRVRSPFVNGLLRAGFGHALAWPQRSIG